MQQLSEDIDMRKTRAGYWFSILLFYIYFFTLSLLADERAENA